MDLMSKDKDEPKIPQINWEHFEYVIAQQATVNDSYISSILDVMDLKFIHNSDIQKYLAIVFDFYRKHSKVPNISEIKTYLATEEQKTSFKNVVKAISKLDSEYDQVELILHTERLLKERSVYNAVLDTVNKYSKENSLVDTDKIYKLFENACNISLIDNLGTDYLNNIDQHIVDLETVYKFISSGYKWMDKMLGGGFLQTGRTLYLYNGGPNSGKSIILGNLAANILAQNKCVVIISLEMSEIVYAKRIDSILSRISHSRLVENKEGLRDFVYTFRKDHTNARLFLKEYAPKSITVNNIKAYLKKLIMKKKIKPDVVIVDYVNLIKALKESGSLYEDIKSVAEELRALSYIFECPFITAAQLNRSGVDVADPGMEMISESMGLSHTADAMMSIWSTEEERALGVINFGMMKSRFGINFGKCAFRIDWDNLAIDEINSVFSKNEELTSFSSTLQKIAKEVS